MTAEKPEGLGTTIQRLKDLCQHDPEALNLIDSALQRPAGGPNNPEGIGGWSNKPKVDNVDNIHVDKIERPSGTSRAAGLRRLRKDRPDLLDKVVAGEMTVNRAAIDAGFRKPQDTWTAPTDIPKLVRAIRKRYNEDQIRLLAQILLSNTQEDTISG